MSTANDATETRGPGRPRKVSMSSTVDEKVALELKQLQARAVSAREMRRNAPAVDVKGKVSIPTKIQIERAARDSGGQDGEFHWSHQDKRDVAMMVDKGYEPGLDPDTGKWLDNQGDPLMKIPTKDFEQTQRENTALSKAMLGEKVKADAAATGETVTTSEVNL